MSLVSRFEVPASGRLAHEADERKVVAKYSGHERCAVVRADRGDGEREEDVAPEAPGGLAGEEEG